MMEENNEVLVKVEGLSKKFCKDLKTSLWYGVKDLASNAFGNKAQRSLRDKEFWAVKDVNFELRRGECLGLIGHNGAGKSTLLKILNGLINPDEGKVTINGRVGALIELGAGFNPILTGRENIYNNGAVLGFSKAEVDAKIEDIIDFSEIREFIDMPVQNYSSGMKVRLGFAVAAQMEPDVLIIDEVLAVGDTGFKIKSYNKISELSMKTAIIFVSHSMPQVARISTSALYMNKGRAKYYYNNVGLAIESYDKSFSEINQSSLIGSDVEISKISVNKTEITSKKDIIELTPDSKLQVEIELFLKNISLTDDLFFTLVISDKSQRALAILDSSSQLFKKRKDQSLYSVNIELEELLFASGLYTLTLNIYKRTGNESRIIVGRMLNFVDIIMKGEVQESYAPIILKGNWS